MLPVGKHNTAKHLSGLFDCARAFSRSHDKPSESMLGAALRVGFSISFDSCMQRNTLDVCSTPGRVDRRRP